MINPLLPWRAAIVGAAILLSLPPAFAAPTEQELLQRQSGRQLSGRPPCRHRARFCRSGGLLPQRAQGRSEKSRSARPRLPLRAHRRRHRSSRQACRPAVAGRPHRPHRPPRRRRSRAQAEGLFHRPAGFCPVGARPGDRSYRDAVVGLGARRRGRYARLDRYHGQAVGPGLVFDLQGYACRPHPRSCQQQEGCRQALRARLQARSHRGAHGRGLRPLPGARRQQGRCAEGLWRFQQGAAGPSADRPGNEGGQRRRQAAALGRIRRKPAPPKRSTGSAPRSAAAAARIWR